METLNNYYEEVFFSIEDFVDFFMEKAKLYIKVDFDDEDEIIKMLVRASISALENLIGCKYTELEIEELPRAELYILAFISHAYSNRNLTVKSTETSVNRMFSSLLLSLRYKDRGVK